MNFNSPILFPWWLKAKFFTRCFYFYHNENKEEQKSTLEIFLKDVTEKKKCGNSQRVNLDNLNIQKI